ncbi:hypothetical protein [Bacillus sp. T33-2]|uniref:hypothetical protein n=1 Tax=Bacillus sp. T33-2 TaxID=2054168 RepID=UPI000C780B1C|nr:hypothetical protein [Bacillus sp. T33-2]PLR95755.1 hypothetical protein CVD19_13550 [Bacillus sp. T33-2]
MAIAAFSKFDDFKERIQALSLPLEEATLINESFLLDKDEKKNLEIYYAPFEHVNENAQIVIAGITPGFHQMKRSFATVLELKDQDKSDESILHEVKKNSSFEGPMRKNLITMLDELNLHNHLGLASSSELFGEASSLVHTTSVITYPVFHKGKNYSGSTPNILKTELLKDYIVQGFAREMKSLKNPLIIPLGVNVEKVLHYLAENNRLAPENILSGFPHPSGGNGHRHRQFEENKAGMEKTLRSHFGS